MPATKKGVYHNLRESTYTVSNTEIVFFFSSKHLLNKFMSRYKTNRESFNQSIKKVVDETPINFDTLADIKLYEKVEKRGFYVWVKGVEISCQELHQYALRPMTKPSTLDWREIQRPKLAERLKIMA